MSGVAAAFLLAAAALPTAARASVALGSGNNRQRVVLHVDPCKDGLSDALEINVYGTDPLDADSDSDGVNDGLELCVCSALDLCPGDLTNDAVVSVADLLLLLGLFGATC